MKDKHQLSLGDRMKMYENQCELVVPPESHIIARIDGHHFSKFTKKFKKPFDDILSETMRLTTKDLLNEFQAVSGYTQSDEITLVIPAKYKETLKPISYKDILSSDEMCEVANIPEYRVYDREDNYVGYLYAYTLEYDEEGYNVTDFYISDDEDSTIDQCSLQHRNPQTIEKTEKMFSKYLIKEVQIKNEQIFGGRVQKMASLFASFVTIRFNYHLENQMDYALEDFHSKDDLNWKEFEDYLLVIKKKIGTAWFDCRIYGVPTKEEAFNIILWRVHDCIRNSRSMFAQAFCSHKELQNKNGNEQIQYCFEKTGEDWNTVPNRYKYGILIKREKFLKPVVFAESDGTMDYSQNEFVERTRITNASVPLMFTDANVNMIMSKVM
jgi:tRNA(His) 5'-end guanylyltransferase